MDETDGIPRRWLLIGGASAIVAGAAGGLAGLLPDRSPDRPRPNPPPAELVAAAATEQALIADLDATTGGTFVVRRAVAAARADHAEHLRVLRGLLARYNSPALSGSRTATPAGASSAASAPRGTPRTRAQLRAAERRAAAAAARRAASLGGAVGAVLASVSACETTHAELFA